MFNGLSAVSWDAVKCIQVRIFVKSVSLRLLNKFILVHQVVIVEELPGIYVTHMFVINIKRRNYVP